MYVSLDEPGNGDGSMDAPFKSIEEAKSYVIDQLKEKPQSVEILLKEGVYFLKEPLVISEKELGLKGHTLQIKSVEGQNVTLSAGVPLDLAWQQLDEGIWKAQVKGVDSIPALFTDRSQLTLARYPNFKNGVYPFGGFAADAIATERVKSWANPAGGYIHAMHQGRWGGMHYEITGKKDDSTLEYIGGWQNNRPSPMHPEQLFVEGIFEELDAQGEWYFNREDKELYYYPYDGEDPNKVEFIAASLENIIHIQGSSSQPTKNITIQGINFRHTAPTFMKTREQLMRSDWAIYRTGAILLEGTEHCEILDNNFQHLAGNAIFVSGYNKGGKIASNLIEHIGASGISFVGDSKAVRSPSYRYEEFVAATDMDRIAGPKTEDFPSDIIAEDNLIRYIGGIEKQVAGIQIQMAQRITARNNTIYQVPRSGINIGDGAWGGHVLEYNDVFETVLETGDHGAFNSWGRDRFWHPDRKVMDSLVKVHPEWILLDAIQTTVIRNNRFQCDYGWDIDLDDGSSNYEIYNNLCLSGGIKLREGFYRKVYNNLTINNGFHPHVWFENSGDEFKRNLVMTAHQPIGISDWGDQVDSNFFTSQADLDKSRSFGVDSHSKWYELEFVDAAAGDFHLKPESEILKDGFQQLDFEKVGVQTKRLKDLAASPSVPELMTASRGDGRVKETTWRGLTVKAVETLGEQSAAGLSVIEGVLVLEVPENSPLARQGLQKGDVILSCYGEPINDPGDLKKQDAANRWKGVLELRVWRNQGANEIAVKVHGTQ